MTETNTPVADRMAKARAARKPKGMQLHPKSEIDQMRDLGMTDAEIKTAIMSRGAPMPAPAPALTADQRADAGALRPDAAVVAAHAAKVANLPPQPLPTSLVVVLEDRWYNILVLYREILRGQRNDPDMTDAQALAQLVRWSYTAHPDIKSVASQGKAAFVHPDMKR